jgi:hypothetical protein
MGKLAARNASFILDDSAAASQCLSGDFNSITLTYSAEAPEVTGFGSNVRERMQDGIKDWELTFDAFFNNDANRVDRVLSGILGASTRFKFAPAGSATGASMYTACAILTSYEMTFGVEDAGTVSGTLVARSGSLTRAIFEAGA